MTASGRELMPPGACGGFLPTRFSSLHLKLSRQGEERLRRLDSAERGQPKSHAPRPAKVGRPSNPNERSDVHERCRRR